MTEAKRTDIEFDEDTLKIISEVFNEQPWTIRYTDKIELLFEILEEKDEASLIACLLKRAYYFDGNRQEDAAKAVAKKILGDWNLSPTDTAIVATDIDESTGSSKAALEAVRVQLAGESSAWESADYPGKISELKNKTDVKNIVLLDDFIGSGKKVNNLIDWLEKGFHSSVNFYIVSYAAHSKAITSFEARAIKFFCFRSLDRGISDHYHDAEIQKAKNTMYRIADRFASIRKKQRLGFDKTESLYFPQNLNTPNNVFPVFWQKKCSYSIHFKPILTRATQKKKSKVDE